MATQLTYAERDALAQYAAAYGKVWRSNLLQLLDYGIYTPSGTRTFLAQGMKDDLISAIERLGKAGVKKYKVPRFSAAYHKSLQKKRRSLRNPLSCSQGGSQIHAEGDSPRTRRRRSTAGRALVKCRKYRPVSATRAAPPRYAVVSAKTGKVLSTHRTATLAEKAAAKKRTVVEIVKMTSGVRVGDRA